MAYGIRFYDEDGNYDNIAHAGWKYYHTRVVTDINVVNTYTYTTPVYAVRAPDSSTDASLQLHSISYSNGHKTITFTLNVPEDANEGFETAYHIFNYRE